MSTESPPHGDHHAGYTATYLWLLLLLGVGVAASFLPLEYGLVVGLIFATAVVKAILVLRNFMHLKFEGLVIYAIFFVPVILFAIMTLILVPDVIMAH